MRYSPQKIPKKPKTKHSKSRQIENRIREDVSDLKEHIHNSSKQSSNRKALGKGNLKSNAKCYLCHGQNHFEEDCSNDGVKSCSNCNFSNHDTMSCKFKRPKTYRKRRESYEMDDEEAESKYDEIVHERVDDGDHLAVIRRPLVAPHAAVEAGNLIVDDLPPPPDAPTFDSIEGRTHIVPNGWMKIMERPHIKLVSSFVSGYQLGDGKIDDGVSIAYQVGTVPIVVPQGLVFNLQSKCLLLDHNEDGYKVLQAYCSRLLREWNISAQLEYTWNLWCPVIAWTNYWKDRQSVTVIVRPIRGMTVSSHIVYLGRYWQYLNTCYPWTCTFIKVAVPTVLLLHCGYLIVKPIWKYISSRPGAVVKFGSQLFNRRYKTWICDLTTMGIEPNPGPNYWTKVPHILARNTPVSGNVPQKDKSWIRRVRNVPDDMKISTRVYQTGGGSDAYQPVVYASNAHNEFESLKQRVCVATPEPDKKFSLRWLKWCKINHDILFPNFWDGYHSVSFDEYIKASNARPSVKEQLKQARQYLVMSGVTDRRIPRKEVKEWVLRKSFVKVEKLNYLTPLGVKPKAPRMIQGAENNFIATMGPWTMAIQRAVKTCWSGDFSIKFTSGVSSDVCASHVDQPGFTVVTDDISVFDSSVGKYCYQYEQWLINKWRATPLYKQLYDGNKHSRGRTAHGWSYSSPYGRKSGDPWTSLFNSIINATMHCFILSDSMGISCRTALKNSRMLVQGDDNVLVYKYSKSIDWKAKMLLLGFKAEGIYHNTIDTTDFCSCLFERFGGVVRYTPKPGKLLSKFGYFINPPLNVKPQQLMRGNVLGLMPSVGHVPLVRRVLEYILKATNGYDAVVLKPEEWKMSFVQVPETLSDSVLHHYGVDSAGSLVCFCNDSSVYRWLYDKDTDGPNCF